MIIALGVVSQLAFGEIFGDLRFKDAYVSDAPVRLACGTDTVQAKTDSGGSYRLKTTKTGKCTIIVTYRKENPSLPVVVFDKPTRYRLLLEEQNGKLILKRV